jgi:hypothetical protein
MNKGRHLAELNIGRLLHPQDDPRVADFMNNLDLVNALAERSQGFIWRMKDETGNATSIRAFDDPQMIVNVSVWESVEVLERFVWQTIHKRFYGRRTDWFDKMHGPQFVMWWVQIGHRPLLPEALERLEHLATHGPSEHAFGWESVPAAQLWKTARCDAPGGQAA